MTVAALNDCLDGILAKIQTSPYIDRKMQQVWAQRIMRVEEWTVLALLMLYLLNLRSITIFDSYKDRDIDCLKRLISDIANASTEHTRNRSTPLSKLSDVRLECQSTKDGASGLEWLSSFAGLPSLRRLSGNAVTGHCSKRSNPLQLSSGITLTDIEFTRSDIELGIFKYLLSRITSLQTFKYSYEGLPHNRASWEPRNIIQLLKNYAAHSLEDLDLINLFGQGPGKKVKLDTTFVDFLPGFHVLKRVRLDHSLFIENRPTPTFKKGRPHTLDLELYIMRYGNVEQKVHRLVDLLPASIEEVDLVSPCRGKAEALAMMEGLPELKPSRTPLLRALRFEVDDELDKGVKDSFSKAGIGLTWWKGGNVAAR